MKTMKTMKTMKIRFFALAALILSLLATSGGCGIAEITETQRTTILIAAAASLENVLKGEIIPAFQNEYPGITVEATYASSGNLQTQIEEGLEADIFFSAATKQMNALSDKGLVDKDSVVNLLENALVLIVPIDSLLEISSFSDIIKADTISLGDPASVPAGQYAQAVLEDLGVYGEALAKASLASNVTEALNAVAEASADAGIVYATDAASMPDKVKVAADAPAGAEKVIYPVGIVSASQNRNSAQLFVDFLQDKTASDAFAARGFKPIAGQ
ncbi:MAG: molybdate ABC transporter substrate-binding protein [Clostridiales bacterium]|jgi:molybdate transport system substrate-binding protein|nr:molybdate ABC transporter substrate-binding protein [Clostridiales bacterium]